MCYEYFQSSTHLGHIKNLIHILYELYFTHIVSALHIRNRQASRTEPALQKNPHRDTSFASRRIDQEFNGELTVVAVNIKEMLEFEK